MLSYLTAGIILGFSAGFAPGPLLALVVAETLQHDIMAGVKVGIAPILTDLPIICLTLFILGKLSRFHGVLGIISIIGACFILYLGMTHILTRGADTNQDQNPRNSLQRGILVNILSPYPYLFWFSVGGPTTMKAMQVDFLAAFSLVAGFYLLLVGAKIVLAVLVGKSRSFLQGNTYKYIMRVLGLILIILACYLFRDGFGLLNIL